MPKPASSPRGARFDTYVGFTDEAAIVRQLDRLVARSGLKRADHLRMALRSYLQQVPTEPQLAPAAQTDPIST